VERIVSQCTEAHTPVFQFLTDPVTGLGTRRALFAALGVAVSPTAAPSVLAIFDLSGFKEYQRAYGTRATENLLMHMSAVFRCAIGDRGLGYRPREDEFVALIDAPQDDANPLVAGTLTKLRLAGESYTITSSCGIALLPDEADDAILALTVADRRLEAITGRGSRRERPR
jgi:two-component system, cell cycle response regulator